MQPRVRDHERDDAVRWEAFVAACPAATFFHRVGWREVEAPVPVANALGPHVVKSPA
jgi:hypothetical protein